MGHAEWEMEAWREAFHFKSQCWEKQLCRTDVAARLLGSKVIYDEIVKDWRSTGGSQKKRWKKLWVAQELNLGHFPPISSTSQLSHHLAASQLQDFACHCFPPFTIHTVSASYFHIKPHWSRMKGDEVWKGSASLFLNFLFYWIWHASQHRSMQVLWQLQNLEYCHKWWVSGRWNKNK